MTEHLVLAGKLDLTAVPDLHTRVAALLGQDAIVDFGKVTQIGALCLQSLIAAAQAQKKTGHGFSVINVCPEVETQMINMGISPNRLSEGLL